MKNSILTSIVFALCVNFTFASVQTDIEKANKEGSCVFLVVTETGNTNNEAALDLAKEAHKLSSKSTVIELNRTDKANKNLITKYRLSGAGLPLVLVIAANGVEAGGVPILKYTTAQDIVTLIPSPKKADVLKIINEGNPVFLVVSKKTMTKKEVLIKCETACAEMKGNAKTVEIDFDDAAEKMFLSSLKITEIGNEPQTYVINNQGMIVGSYTGVPDSKILVATASKKPAGGCCPPGSKKSCGPTK
jgi:hypothetical protein